MRRRLPQAWRALVVGGVVLVGMAALTNTMRAQAGEPFLWKAERTDAPPIWLFGTIHVPDARVLQLAPQAQAAFSSATHVVTEIPLDLDAQLGIADALMLPANERLTDVLGPERFERLQRVVTATLEDQQPLVTMALLAALDRLKPWAAMAQLALLDYLPDVMAGRPSLDARLFAEARSAGKALSALETVEEQAQVFDAFTLEEQVALLDSTLAQVERGVATGESPGRQLVDLYLSGDVTRLTAALRADGPSDAALAGKFERVLLRDRNRRMAERLQHLRTTHAADELFVAVGALHLVGDDSLPAILEAQGYRVTRVRR
jgi:uncharacterized protein